MERLWAPWRLRYVRKAKKQNKCIFCAQAKENKNKYLIFKTRHSLMMLNIFPYNNGHVMISPKRHVADFEKLNAQEALDIFESIKRAKRLLDKVLKPHGYNVGINLSASAGAGITGHMHIHIVPRWKGDTNFMPLISGTKIISQSLEELSKKLKHANAKSN